MKQFISFFILISFYSCHENDINTKQIIESYYQTYQDRNNFQKFLSFYDENIILEDIMFGEKIIGKEKFAEFFDWENPKFKKLEEKTLIIKEQIFDKNKVVTKGYFTPFKWGEYECEAMHFTTILTLNETGKIIKHVDWINYPSTLIDYEKRKNSNDWINYSSHAEGAKKTQSF